MTSGLVVRVAGSGDVGALASLRSLWSADAAADLDFERRMAAWLADAPVGIASVFEYRRMPRPDRPSVQAVPFYRRAGFIVPDDAAGDDRLLVRVR